MDASSIIFAVVALAMTAGALAFVLPALRQSADAVAVTTLSVHVETTRRALAELEQQRADGHLDDVQHVQARVDIERRLIEDAPQERTAATLPPPRWVAATLVAIVPVAALAVYATLGEPTLLGATPWPDGMADSETLARYVRAHPRDARAWILLARTHVSTDRFGDAAAAYARALEVPQAARDPGVYAEYAEALAMAQGGRLAGQPARIIGHALALDPRHAQTLELAGSAAYEAGDYAAAVGHWRTLQGELPDDDRRLPELAAAIARAERLAAVSLRPMIAARRDQAAP